MESLVGFPVMKDFFTLNSLFVPAGLEFFCVTFENSGVKINTDRPILLARNM